MNVYEMVKRNNGKIGFWVQRDTWLNTCAKVVRVGQMRGYQPYYGSPTVRVDMYHILTGEVLEKNIKLRCPGTNSYTKISTPEWYKKRQKMELKKWKKIDEK